MGMYIGMIQGMRDYLIELNTGMQQGLGTTSPFPLASVPEDNEFNGTIMSCVRFLTSNLQEVSLYFPEENATDPDMKLDPDMAGLSYYVNLAMIIGRRS